jgi:hypothetical protein
MAQSLEELVNFTKTATFSSLNPENQRKIHQRISFLSEKQKLQQELAAQEAIIIERERVESKRRDLLIETRIQETISKMEGFIPSCSRIPIKFSVFSFGENIGSLKFYFDDSPILSFADLQDIATRLGTTNLQFHTATIKLRDKTDRYNDLPENRYEFVVMFSPKNKPVANVRKT